MATMDIFNNSAFSATSLSGMVEKMDYVPQLLGSLNLFEPEPVRTRNVFVDRIEGGLTLIPTSADGAPPDVLGGEDRDAVSLRTTRLAKRFTLYAHELDGIRATGSETELMGVQREFGRRLGRIRNDMEVTHEHHRLGALQGVLLDADGSTVIYDYSAEFNEAIPAAVSFELDVDTTDVHKKCKDIARSMARSGKGSLASASIHALAGDDFYDALISHPNVEKFYLQQQAANPLREAQGQVFESFRIGGITFHNYRGTDDNATVAIPTDEAKFFPVGARDVFKVAYSPLEALQFVNTPGQSVYAINVPDRQRNMWTKGELYSYPLYMCQQPRVLRRATRT
ncbi:major capsid protein [Roseobacter sp. HKCCD9010]|uniref:major capsid protein n=2 Tax=unclassified Roseobacter TaxID=196798 RepID=UPI0014921CE7|nr:MULTISPECIES: major capsid protein [unclassified Roseobacter]MBF9050645.1 major capsid protein [Rhodobacterales bacterium HKCCD4356]NNV38958.1 major capsid protein [Roseobacter sp. HKCCD9054]NNZ18173.1 major capsid protein [Roseobacter sp. HKCCD6301]NNZ64969.1 major capsid protein [Roseobacter sp. HKCCD5928]NNZ68744.1 major capsid protein [Roseobacter sp. HKCCD6544]NOA19460.1 major capsid protein [Roseobacter sp. HKCCD6541]NOA32217.1 major capsid protein [Roseobacter sp. HKCCD6510]NOB345